MITLKIVRIPEPRICSTATTTETSIISLITWYEYNKCQRLLIITTFDHPVKIYLFDTIDVKVIE